MLLQVHRAGLEVVELYLSKGLLKKVPRIIQLCKNFSLRYVVHAPNDGSATDELAGLTQGIRAGIVVFHNCYWKDEGGGCRTI